jgi:hypothetical protein
MHTILVFEVASQSHATAQRRKGKKVLTLRELFIPQATQKQFQHLLLCLPRKKLNKLVQ